LSEFGNSSFFQRSRLKARRTEFKRNLRSLSRTRRISRKGFTARRIVRIVMKTMTRISPP
jgi:hypothetical protein